MFKLNLSQEMISIIGHALLELPAKQSHTTINEINRQVQAQHEQQQTATREADEKRVQILIDAALKKAKKK